MFTLGLSYVFERDEEVKEGFVRVLGGISARGQILTQASHEPTGELIHEGRVLIKRMRALLWFARPALSDAAYTRARTRLRKAAGLLADQRDLAVTQATLEKLGHKGRPGARDQAALAEVFQSLVRDSAAGGATEEALRQMLQKAMKILRQSADEIKRSIAARASWPSRCERLKKAFRAMRKAGKKARRGGKDTDFHEWRKKAKGLLYQLELTQAEPGREMARVMKRVEKLQDKLGAQHDAVVVVERLRKVAPLSGAVRRVLGLLEKRKARLRKRACKIARRV
jgi:CHAD domain-containing protein